MPATVNVCGLPYVIPDSMPPTGEEKGENRGRLAKRSLARRRVSGRVRSPTDKEKGVRKYGSQPTQEGVDSEGDDVRWTVNAGGRGNADDSLYGLRRPGRRGPAKAKAPAKEPVWRQRDYQH